MINGDKGLFSAFPVYGCVLGDAINSDEVPMRSYWYVTQAFHRQAENNWKMTIVPLLDNFLNFFFDLRKTGGGAQISLDAWLIMNAHPMKANGYAKLRRDLKVQKFPDPRRQIFDLGSQNNRHTPKSKIWRS